MLAAQIAEHLDLIGHCLTAVNLARQKILTRELCRKAGIPTPRFARIHSHSNLEMAAAEVRFPAVLKPISGLASLSVYKVKSLAELQVRYNQVLGEISSAHHEDHTHSDDQMSLVWASGTDMLLEEYLDGEEFDVDCLMSEGKLVYANLVRDLPQPHMIEIGSQMPPNYPEDRQAVLTALVEQVLGEFGFHDGAFHVEVKDTSNGPRLIEVNARIGGGPVCALHRQVWGIDLIEQYLMTQLGIPIRPAISSTPLSFFLTSDLPAPYTGIVAHSDFLEHLASHPHIVAAYPKVRPGQRVVGPDTGVPEWLGEIIVQGESIAHAERMMTEILAELQFPIIPEGSVHTPAATPLTTLTVGQS